LLGNIIEITLMLKYPIGVQDFEKLRTESYLYIDKTEMIFRLVNDGCYYFLSRPRRFGKSLLLSTIQAYFEGKKDLFEGLAIAGLEKEWAAYPVLRMDLGGATYKTKTDLDTRLAQVFAEWEELYGITTVYPTPAARFSEIIKAAACRTGRSVVILVDEYDKPIIDSLENEELREYFRSTLQGVYSVIKTQDDKIRFGLLTGVTKIGKLSVFSGLNNLKDISMLPAYSDICGITERELVSQLSAGVSEMAAANNLTDGECLERLKDMYDGYHFCPDSPGIYNPFSLLNTFAKGRYGSYWFETGTPTYLVELLKKSDYDLEQMSREETDTETLDSIFTGDNPIPVIYQSGYLTIKKYNRRFDLYTLGFPNREVEEGFLRFLMPYYAKSNRGKSGFEIKRFVDDVEKGDIDGFMERLQSFLSDCPYELARDAELHYQNVLFIVFRLAGLYTQVEYHTSRGRIDIVVQTADYVYVMEFKLDGTAEQALQQIEEKQYALPFAADSRKVFRIGVNFSSETRNIDRWIVQ